jgi:hypothetical protein
MNLGGSDLHPLHEPGDPDLAGGNCEEGASPHPSAIERVSELVQGDSPWYETGGWHEGSGRIGT